MVGSQKETALRDSRVVRRSVEAVRNGDDSKKANNYYRVPNAKMKPGVTVTRRANANLLPSHKVFLDFDSRGRWEEIYNKVAGREEELGVLHAEKSAHYGLHLDVRQIKGLTIEQTIIYWSKLLDEEIDMCKDLARACYLVPNEDVIYIHEDYWKDEVEPIDMNISEEDIASLKPVIRKVEKQYKGGMSVCIPVEGTDVCSHYQSTYADNAQELKYLIDNEIVSKKLDITANEPDWHKLSVVCANILGEEEGREYYHKLSQFYPAYTKEETDRKFNNALSHTYPYSMATFVYIMCKYNCKQ